MNFSSVKCTFLWWFIPVFLPPSSFDFHSFCLKCARSFGNSSYLRMSTSNDLISLFQSSLKWTWNCPDALVSVAKFFITRDLWESYPLLCDEHYRSSTNDTAGARCVQWVSWWLGWEHQCSWCFMFSLRLKLRKGKTLRHFSFLEYSPQVSLH